MDNRSFIKCCAEYMELYEFLDVFIIEEPNIGINITALKNGNKYGVRCIYTYFEIERNIIQQTYSGARAENCDIAAVMTNSDFSISAIQNAENKNVKLWSFDIDIMKSADPIYLEDEPVYEDDDPDGEIYSENDGYYEMEVDEPR